MTFRNGLVLLTSIAAFGADRKDGRFQPGPASSYRSKQTVDKVTIATTPFETEAKAKEAFGKMNPYQHGVLPVLVVIQNDLGKTIRLEHMQVEYVAPDRTHVEATPSTEVKYIGGGRRPSQSKIPIPVPGGQIKVKKNPLTGEEIEGRAFVAKMLPPGESASGFFYFQTGHRNGSKLYVTGIMEAGTNRELFYFEIPFE